MSEADKMVENMKKGKTIVEFKKIGKNIAEVEVNIYDSTVGEIIVGLAETIQMIMEETKETKEDVIEDINKILEILLEDEKQKLEEEEK